MPARRGPSRSLPTRVSLVSVPIRYTFVLRTILLHAIALCVAGVDLEKLLELNTNEVVELLPSRIRRRFSRGLTKAHLTLVKKLRKAKKDAKTTDKPTVIKTHLRDLPILPEMVGSVVAVYNGKVFNVVEIKPEMIGKYLAEFSITYKPTLHGRPGLGATHSSRFIPLH